MVIYQTLLRYAPSNHRTEDQNVGQSKTMIGWIGTARIMDIHWPMWGWRSLVLGTNLMSQLLSQQLAAPGNGRLQRLWPRVGHDEVWFDRRKKLLAAANASSVAKIVLLNYIYSVLYNIIAQ